MNLDPVQAAIQAAIAKAASQSDHGKAVKGGGDDVKEGLTVVTLVGYVECGVQQHDIPNKPSYDSNDVMMVFELNGGANKAAVVDGKIFPNRVTVQEKLSQNEKANYLKIFNAMNYDGQCTHGSQLVGRHFLADVFVNEKGYAGFKGPNGYTIRAPFVIKGDPLDPDNCQKVAVPAPARGDSTDKVFLWDYACQEMWDTIFIDGEYEARKDEKTGKEYPAKSKNKFQLAIKAAKNFAGSPIQKLLGDEALNLSESPLTGDPAASASDATSTASATPSDTTNPTAAVVSDAASDATDDPLAGLV